MTLRSCIYEGTVSHQRLLPLGHKFSYRVFSMLLDLDEISQLDKSLRLFAHNRFNIFSFYDKDYSGEGCGDIASHVRGLLAEMGFARETHRIALLCYPRVLGYVFNPLSTYFCYDDQGRLGLVVYEVTNTYAERKWYVIPTSQSQRLDQPIVQSCEKEMYVSPFSVRAGAYQFRITDPSNSVYIGIDLHEERGKALTTHFQGNALPFKDAQLVRLWLTYPLMTVKVIAAIHFEAFRLWCKGMKIQDRFMSPKFSYSIYNSQQEI